MQKTTRTGVLLAGALAITASLTLGAAAQNAAAPATRHPGLHPASFDLGLMYTAEHGQVAMTGSPSFWLNGGAADLSVNFAHGLGIAAEFGAAHASNIQPGVSLGKVTYMFGPRYTLAVPRHHGVHSADLFAQWLIGGVHAYGAPFPSSGAVVSTANNLSMELGGGIDIPVKGRFAVRALEASWIHTDLPNNASNSQNDLRLGAGMRFRF